MGKWEEIKTSDLRAKDYVRVVTETRRWRTVVESEVIEIDPEDDSFYLEATDTWHYESEFGENRESKLYRKRKPFEWPNKLGAIVSYEENGETVLCVLVALDTDTEDPYHEFYNPMYGNCNKADLEGCKNLKVVFEGVDVEEGN